MITKRNSYIALSLVMIITIFFASQLHKLRIDYDYENFFPESDTLTDFFSQHRERFETDNDFLLIGIESKEGILHTEFLVKVDSLTKDLQRNEHITSVVSPTNFIIRKRSFNAPGKFDQPLLNYSEWENSDSVLYYDSLNIRSYPGVLGIFISEDYKSVSIFAKTTEYLSKEKCDELANDVKVLVNSYRFNDTHLAGRSVGQQYYINMMSNELRLFTLLAVSMIIIVLWFSFKALWGVVVPLIVVLFSLIWIVGMMALIDLPFSLLLTVLPTIILVVGLSDVVHIVSKYIDELRHGKLKIEAITVAFKEVGWATFLTSLTTAIGFLTLVYSNIKPIREFGIITSIGVFFAYILAFTLLPSLLVLMKQPKISTKQYENNFWYKLLHRSFRLVIRNKLKVVIAYSIILLLSLYGVYNIKQQNFLLEGLKDDDPFKQDFAFFDNTFSGVRPLEISITSKQGEKMNLIENQEVLLEIEQVERKIEEIYEANYIISPATLFKGGNMTMYMGNPEFFVVPENKKDFRRMVKQIQREELDSLRGLVISDDFTVGRITARTADIGSIPLERKKEKLFQYIQDSIPDSKLSYTITGTAELIDVQNKNISWVMLEGLLIAVLLVAIIMSLLYRDVKLVLISIVPNLIPLLMIGGVMGAVGIDLKINTAVIFTIAFGIAVDDTIHFMSRLKLELNKGKSMLYALKRTYLSTGKAIILTSLILIAGFGTLIFSTFMGTVYIGFLNGLTLLFAVIADLTILPVLMILLFSRK